MITNIVDHRSKPYRWKTINAVMENTWQDNACDDADQADQKPLGTGVTYDERRDISVLEAIAWGTRETAEVPLYFYDLGQGF